MSKVALKRTAVALAGFFLLAALCTVFPVQRVYAAGITGDGTEESPYILTEPDHLDYLRSFSGYAELGGNIDLAGTLAETNAGWNPISGFSGNLDGKGFTISGLWSDGGDGDDIGLFGYVWDATIQNLHIVVDAFNNGLQGFAYVGPLAGYATNSDFINCTVTGPADIPSVTARSNAGGLVGTAYDTGFTDCHTVVYVYVDGDDPAYEAGYCAGGIVGGGEGNTITGCTSAGRAAAGTLNSFAQIGGIAGWMDYGWLADSHTTGTVEAHANASRVGGLVGVLHESTVLSSYSAATVFSEADSTHVGGLVGFAGETASTIANSYYVGAISVRSLNTDAGGLVGHVRGGLYMANSYSAGEITIIYDDSFQRISNAGGLAGGIFDLSGSTTTIENCYTSTKIRVEGGELAGFAGAVFGWYEGTHSLDGIYYSPAISGMETAAGKINMSSLPDEDLAAALTPQEMKQKESFVDWSFDDSLWGVYEGYGTPYLEAFENHILVTPEGGRKVYDGQPVESAVGWTADDNYNPALPLAGQAAYTETPLNAGSYPIVRGSLYSPYYQISFRDDISYTVDRATPSAPVALKGVYGDALTTVALPQGWAWQDPSARLSASGTLTFTAAYTSADPNYSDAQQAVAVAVSRRPITVTARSLTINHGETPVLAWEVTRGSLVGGDTLRGSLKAAGTVAGTHAIVEDEPFSHQHYDITFIPGEITILPVAGSSPGPSTSAAPAGSGGGAIAKTGDVSPMGGLLALALLGSIGAVWGIFYRKKRA